MDSLSNCCTWINNTFFLLNSISKYFISIKIIQTQNNYSKDEWQFLPPISKQCIYLKHRMAQINDKPPNGIPEWVLICEYLILYMYRVSWSKLNTGRVNHTVAFRDTERVFTGTLQLHGLASQTDVEFTTFYRVSIKLFIIWRNTMAHFWNGRKAHQEKALMLQVTYCILQKFVIPGNVKLCLKQP